MTDRLLPLHKYEGSWKFYGMDYWKKWYNGTFVTDTNLIQDAPLILQALIDERAEVKRLREGIEHALILTRDNNERVDKLRELIE